MSLILLLVLACANVGDKAVASTSAASAHDDAVPAAPVPPAAPPAADAGPRGLAANTPGAGGPPAPGGHEAAVSVEPAYVTNPTSGSKIAMYILTPSTGSGPWPTLVIVPGGDHSARDNELKEGRTDPYLRSGFALVMFDPEGRGNSGGKEDLNGEIGQDALSAVIREAAKDPRIDKSKMGLVSYSFGVANATGALARHPDLPIKFYIDWEGPVSRKYVSGCNTSMPVKGGEGGGENPSKLNFGPCDDEAWWKYREAVQNITKIKVPYWRMQFSQDHVQKTWQHTVDIVQAAEKAGVDVRLNDMGKKPTIKSETDIKPLDNSTPTVFVVARYAVEMMNETTHANMAEPPAAPTRRAGPPGGGGGQRGGGPRGGPPGVIPSAPGR